MISSRLRAQACSIPHALVLWPFLTTDFTLL